MANNDRVAIAAHLHVALRRKAGRVTDMDWMAVNDEYAHEILRLTRQKAQEDGDEGLNDLANKLQACLAQAPAPAPTTPLVERMVKQWREPPAKPPATDGGEGADDRYVGGLR